MGWSSGKEAAKTSMMPLKIRTSLTSGLLKPTLELFSNLRGAHLQWLGHYCNICKNMKKSCQKWMSRVCGFIRQGLTLIHFWRTVYWHFLFSSLPHLMIPFVQSSTYGYFICLCFPILDTHFNVKRPFNAPCFQWGRPFIIFRVPCTAYWISSFLCHMKETVHELTPCPSNP